MNLRKFVSFCLMLLIVTSIAFAQSEPMKKKMMEDSTDTKMMMDKDKMMNDKDMMKDMMKDNTMMNEDMMVNKNDEGVAIQGYDPVAYFEDGKPEMGMMEHSYKWGGATWCFASKDHMVIFEKNPSKFAPQYGGHCAFAASKGYMADADPNAWTIHDGKLYLNYNSDVAMKFKDDISDKIMKADENWKKGNLKEGM